MLVVSVAIWLLTVAVCVHLRRRTRRSDHLTYALPQPKGLAGVGRSFVRSVEALTYGSSVEMWRARCAASLRASRRRRGVDA